MEKIPRVAEKEYSGDLNTHDQALGSAQQVYPVAETFGM